MVESLFEMFTNVTSEELKATATDGEWKKRVDILPPSAGPRKSKVLRAKQAKNPRIVNVDNADEKVLPWCSLGGKVPGEATFYTFYFLPFTVP